MPHQKTAASTLAPSLMLRAMRAKPNSSITVYGTVITIFNAYGKLTHDYILIVIQLQS